MSEKHDPFRGTKPPTDDAAPTEDAAPAPVAPAAPEPVQEPVQAPADTSAADADENAQEPSQDELKVPAGTTKEVLAWVGDDKTRAKAALDAENASDEPRKGLTRELEERAG